MRDLTLRLHHTEIPFHGREISYHKGWSNGFYKKLNPDVRDFQKRKDSGDLNLSKDDKSEDNFKAYFKVEKKKAVSSEYSYFRLDNVSYLF